MSLLDSLRASRKHPAVLKLKVLKIRGEDPDILIFCYEGPDDVPVYEAWMARIADCPHYEPVAGAGKQQLLAYHKLLTEANDPLIERIFFFVDRDFDSPLPPSNRIFELEAYSIENLICTEEVLESVLKDEFRRAGSMAERAYVQAKFVELRDQFLAFCMPVNFLLFAAQRTGVRVVKKPERVTEIVHITVDCVSVAYIDVGDIVAIENAPSGEILRSLELEFGALDMLLKQRGKYLLEMFRRWLRALTDDLKSPEPVLFNSQDAGLPGDPSALTMRRLASSVSIPISLSQFITLHIIHA